LYVKLISKYLESRFGEELKEAVYELLELSWGKETLSMRVAHELLCFFQMAAKYFENLVFLFPLSIFRLFIFAFL
jgi:hypothetical protein